MVAQFQRERKKIGPQSHKAVRSKAAKVILGFGGVNETDEKNRDKHFLNKPVLEAVSLRPEKCQENTGHHQWGM